MPRHRQVFARDNKSRAHRADKGTSPGDSRGNQQPFTGSCSRLTRWDGVSTNLIRSAKTRPKPGDTRQRRRDRSDLLPLWAGAKRQSFYPAPTYRLS